MNCKDFTLELTKRKDDLNSSVQSLCTTVIQLKDDRLVVSSTDNNLVFWRNVDSVF